MSYLLDTCVLSELARPHMNPHVVEFVSRQDPAQVYVSVITMGELFKGWYLLAEGKRKWQLGDWIAVTEIQYASRILPVDHEVGRLWGEISARARLQGNVIPAADGLIAATALYHGLIVVTRNVGHFMAAGAHVVDPWESS